MLGSLRGFCGASMSKSDEDYAHVVRPCNNVNEAEAEEGRCSEEDPDVCVTCDPDEGEAGRRFVKKLQDPKKPSAEEVEEHEKTHLPYRSWCKACVKGRGKAMPH